MFTLRGLPVGQKWLENKFTIDLESLNQTMDNLRFLGMRGDANIIYNHTRPGWELGTAKQEPRTVLAYLSEEVSPVGLKYWSFEDSFKRPLILHKVCIAVNL